MTHTHNQSQLHSDGVVAFSSWHQTLQRMSMAAPPFNSFPPWTILCKGCYDMTSSPNRSILHPSPCMKKQKVLQTAPGLERQQETSLAANIRITWHHANDFPKHWRHLTLQQFRSEPLMSHQAIMQLQQSPHVSTVLVISRVCCSRATKPYGNRHACAHCPRFAERPPQASEEKHWPL